MAATNNKKKEAEVETGVVVVQHMGVPEGKLSDEEMEWLRNEHPHYAKMDDKEIQKLANEIKPPPVEVPAKGEPVEPEAVVAARKALQEAMNQGATQPGAIATAAGALEAALAEAEAEKQKALDVASAKQLAAEAAAEAEAAKKVLEEAESETQHSSAGSSGKATTKPKNS